jgi:hypothetical protein
MLILMMVIFARFLFLLVLLGINVVVSIKNKSFDSVCVCVMVEYVYTFLVEGTCLFFSGIPMYISFCMLPARYRRVFWDGFFEYYVLVLF